MGLGNVASGWKDVDGYDDYGDSKGGGGGDSGGGMSKEERLYKFRFSIPEPDPDLRKYPKKKPNLVLPGEPATKRVLFLSGSPYCIYEHGLWKVDNAYNVMGGYVATCLVKNQLHESCELCDNKRFPYFIGFFSVIDMGQVEYIDRKVKLHHEFWTGDNGERHFRRFQNCLLGAKRGGRDKPGVLKTLQYEMSQLRNQYGWEDLTGTVWDTTRMGKKSAGVGDSWRFVRRLERNEIEDYLIRFGAEKDELDLSVPTLDLGAPGSALYIDPESYAAKVARLFGGGGSQQQSMDWGNRQSNGERQRGEATGAGFGGSDDDV